MLYKVYMTSPFLASALAHEQALELERRAAAYRDRLASCADGTCIPRPKRRRVPLRQQVGRALIVVGNRLVRQEIASARC